MTQDFGEINRLTDSLQQVDPSARLVVPVHDTIEIICSVQHARDCHKVLQAWAITHDLKPGSTALIPLHPLSRVEPNLNLKF